MTQQPPPPTGPRDCRPRLFLPALPASKAPRSSRSTTNILLQAQAASGACVRIETDETSATRSPPFRAPPGVRDPPPFIATMAEAGEPVEVPEMPQELDEPIEAAPPRTCHRCGQVEGRNFLHARMPAAAAPPAQRVQTGQQPPPSCAPACAPLSHSHSTSPHTSFICRQPGHIARECPDAPPGSNTCYNCGQEG